MTEFFKQKLSLAVTFVALVAAIFGFLHLNLSLAWFSQNDEVAAEGLSVSVEVSPNLVIGTTVDQVMGEELVFAVGFNNPTSTNMIAVTRDASVADSYLKYISSHYGIDRNTGLPIEGVDLEFSPVPADGDGVYFVDYTVYIASAFGELPVSELKASIVTPGTVSDDHSFFNAASIDFYVGSVATENYRGTASVADGSDEGVDLFGGKGGSVPSNAEDYITVIMRCYFDGALIDDEAGYAYINSYVVNTDAVALGVAFIATDKAQ